MAVDVARAGIEEGSNISHAWLPAASEKHPPDWYGNGYLSW